MLRVCSILAQRARQRHRAQTFFNPTAARMVVVSENVHPAGFDFANQRKDVYVRTCVPVYVRMYIRVFTYDWLHACVYARLYLCMQIGRAHV